MLANLALSGDASAHGDGIEGNRTMMVHAQFLDRIADVALGRVESLVVPGEMPDDWPDALAHLERSPVRRAARSTMLMRDGAIGSRMPVIARERGEIR